MQLRDDYEHIPDILRGEIVSDLSKKESVMTTIYGLVKLYEKFKHTTISKNISDLDIETTTTTISTNFDSILLLDDQDIVIGRRYSDIPGYITDIFDPSREVKRQLPINQYMKAIEKTHESSKNKFEYSKRNYTYYYEEFPEYGVFKDHDDFLIKNPEFNY
jgi:hypothetical protein